MQALKDTQDVDMDTGHDHEQECLIEDMAFGEWGDEDSQGAHLETEIKNGETNANI